MACVFLEFCAFLRQDNFDFLQHGNHLLDACRFLVQRLHVGDDLRQDALLIVRLQAEGMQPLRRFLAQDDPLRLFDFCGQHLTRLFLFFRVFFHFFLDLGLFAR